MEDKDKILYRPNIDYDKQYSTKGQVTVQPSEQETEDIDRSSEIKDKIATAKAMIPYMPKDIQDNISDTLDVIEAIIGDNPVPSNPPKKSETEYIPNEVEPKSDTEYPETFERQEPSIVDVVYSENDLIDYIKKKYNYDITSVLEDYLDAVNDNTAQYYENILLPLAELDKDLYRKVLTEYTAYTDDVQDKNYKHLSDMVIKSQITRKMYSRLYNKLFNISKTISHIKACKICVEQKIRYYEASYQNESGLLNVISDKFLENSRIKIDAQYKNTFLNLYKYLHSGTILLNECLKIYTNELQCKTILLDKEGGNLW